MKKKKYKIVNLKNKNVVYADLIVNNRAILEYKVNENNIEIIDYLNISNDEYKVLESTNIKDIEGNIIYDEDAVEIAITVDYRPTGIVSIKNGTAVVCYKEKVFKQKEEPLYSVLGSIKILQNT